MTRSTIAAVALVSVALAAVVVVSLNWSTRDRANLELRLVAEQREQVARAAVEIASDFADIGKDLTVTAQLIKDAGSIEESRRALAALLAVVKPYQMMHLYDDSLTRVLGVTDPLANHDVDRYRGALADAARRAMAEPDGEVVTSPPVEGDATGWLRAFATAFTQANGKRAALVVLAHTAHYFGRLKLMARSSMTHLLVIGPYGRVNPAIDPEFAQAFQSTQARSPAVIGALAERMRRHEQDSVVVSEAEAAALGLGEAKAVVAFAPVKVPGGDEWTVAAVTSMAYLRSEQWANALRVLLTSGAIAFLLVAFGLYFVVASRRAIATRERLRHAERLAHLHEKTEKILNTIPTAVLVLSEDGRVTSVNRAFKERLERPVEGLRLEQAFAQAPAQVGSGLAALAAKVRSSGLATSLRGKGSELFGSEGEYAIQAVPLQPGSEDARVIVVFEDLSEVKAMAEQLSRAEKLATVGVLAAGIAHEIGTPLSVVRARAEYLSGKVGPDQTLLASLKVIVEQIDLVARTIRQLLDFSRPRTVAARSVEFLAVAQGVVELLRFEAQRRKVSLKVSIPPGLPQVSADPDQLQQVLVNLAMNSLDACGASGTIELLGELGGAGDHRRQRHAAHRGGRRRRRDRRGPPAPGLRPLLHHQEARAGDRPRADDRGTDRAKPRGPRRDREQHEVRDAGGRALARRVGSGEGAEPWRRLGPTSWSSMTTSRWRGSWETSSRTRATGCASPPAARRPSPWSGRSSSTSSSAI
ncbi:MAG: histidine kinase dimerization/phospho-acceptor domain-containing protein [Myxococcales bacterium]